MPTLPAAPSHAAPTALLAFLCLVSGATIGAASIQSAPPSRPPAAPPTEPATPDQIRGADAPADETTFVVLFPDLENEALEAVLLDYTLAGHDALSYRRAREIMYWIADNDDGVITTIYDRRPIELAPGTWPDPNIINCEHLWPQSRGASRPPARTDIHHLRPSVPRVNSTRGNLPFGVPTSVGDSEPTTWKKGRGPGGGDVFLPPPAVRGDVARSLFYFAVRYEHDIDPAQEAILRTWHDDDPVSVGEQRRHAIVLEEQGNANPFIQDPGAVERIADF